MNHDAADSNITFIILIISTMLPNEILYATAFDNNNEIEPITTVTDSKYFKFIFEKDVVNDNIDPIIITDAAASNSLPPLRIPNVNISRNSGNNDSIITLNLLVTKSDFLNLDPDFFAHTPSFNFEPVLHFILIYV